MATANRPRVYLEINIGEQPAGRITIELFTDKTPRTCENFRQLCTSEHNGLSYAKSPFHRIIDEFMIQGGDIANGDGTGTSSIYDGEYEDENMSWREMDAPGLVCSANRGRDTNGSQFFVTLEATPHLNGKHTIFGRIVSGQEILDRIAKVDVDQNDRPNTPVLVARCGELERKKRPANAQASTMSNPSAANSADRGRRRKSNDSDDEMKEVFESKDVRRNRRQSDNMVDEGIRGRPKKRSRSRSNSQPLSTPSEEASDSQRSPDGKSKRKRSKSPSRHVNEKQRAEDGAYERRRRSLPNQYGDERYHRGTDGARYKPEPRRDDYREAASRRDDHDNRQGDGYRYSRGGSKYGDEGRLASNSGRAGGGDMPDGPVRFKGLGVMKYMEPGRL